MFQEFGNRPSPLFLPSRIPLYQTEKRKENIMLNNFILQKKKKKKKPPMDPPKVFFDLN
jgi:hypothetical protein